MPPVPRYAEAGTRAQYVQDAGPWGQAALRHRYVRNAGGWHAYRGARVSRASVPCTHSK